MRRWLTWCRRGWIRQGAYDTSNMSKKVVIEYDAYHDESKEAGYWHGILLVSKPSRARVLEHLETIRRKTDFNLPLSLKEVKSGGARFQCSRAAVQLAVAAMMQDTKNCKERVWISKRCYDRANARQATRYESILEIKEALGLKFIVFRERDCLEFMDPSGSFLDYGAKVEITFRMGLKGGLHLMFDETTQARISSIHFEGHQHYQRHVDRDRITGRLKDGLRPYCQIAEDCVIDDRTSDHRECEVQSYDDCQLLQLTDLLVGSFRTVLADRKNDFQWQVAQPVADLVDKWKAGRRRMENSRWYCGFCISQCFLKDGQWHFEILPTKDDSNQLCLSL
jgi:hypothetical protein